MRPSLNRHVLALLRKEIGLNQSDFAELCGVSKATIVSIEVLKLNLSGKLAGRIEDATGIHILWLMDNNLGNPMINWDGKPFIKDNFERAQAFKKERISARDAGYLRYWIARNISYIICLYDGATSLEDTHILNVNLIKEFETKIQKKVKNPKTVKKAEELFRKLTNNDNLEIRLNFDVINDAIDVMSASPKKKVSLPKRKTKPSNQTKRR